MPRLTVLGTDNLPAAGRARPRPVWLLAVLLLSGCGEPPDGHPLLRRADPGDFPRSGLTYGGTLLDCDGDGWRDLVLSRHGELAEVYFNRGDLRFVRSPDEDVLPGPVVDMHGVAGCDFDGDGDWDIFVTLGADEGHGLSYNQLWEQSQPRRFENVAAGNLLLNDPVGRGRGALWAEFSGDRWPDLLLISYESQARLLVRSARGWNDATTWFPTLPSVPLWIPGMPAPTPAERSRSSWIHSATVADFDDDGRADLLALGRGGCSGIWRNTGRGRFQDVTCAWAFQSAFWPQVPSYGCAGDVDEDGDLDLILCYRPQPQEGTPDREQLELWLNERDAEGRLFRRAGLASGLTGGGVIEAGLLVDLDNDGHLDLYVVQNGRRQTAAANLVFRGDGQGHFQPATPLVEGGETPPARAESACIADLDRDGDLDLLACHGAGVEPEAGGGVSLYENRSRRQKGVTLELTSTTGVPHGLGARIEMVLAGRRLVREVSSLATPFSASILPVHFGVGEQTGPFKVEIRWPGGREQEVTLPRAGAAYRLEEGATAATVLPRKYAAG